MPGVAAETLASWLAARREDIAAELAEWVRIPSVAGAPEHGADMQRSADWLARLLRRIGFPDVQVWSDDGPPAVYADWPAGPDVPTVLVYSHHDVRAIRGEDWTRGEPFEPLRDAQRLFGRGSSDAKGQLLAHLWAVRAYLAVTGHALPVALRLIVDGEEEAGSPTLRGLLEAHRKDVAADLVVLSDTMTWAADRPALCTGVRGMMKARLEVRAAPNEVHAGATSGAAPNPASELVRVLAQLHDERGEVAIEGFYDDAADASEEERAAFAALMDEAGWAARTGLPFTVGESGRQLGERLYTRPAVEVVMLDSGESDPPTTGTIPASARADLQVSLVPDQDPDTVGERLRAWFAGAVGAGFDGSCEIQDTISQPPYRTPPDHPALAALAQAMTDAWGRPVGRMRNAGGAPTVLLAETARAPVLFFGTGLPEDNWHAPDESVDLDVLVKGACALALFWSRSAGLS
jgi:acetylornithine deacetylase/succinyl-diaminopimelate desuccinylase-like protein